MTTIERPETEVQESTPVLTVTPLALGKIREIMTQRELTENHALRVFVAGGGCSGMSYGMAFEDNFQDYDTVFEVEGVKLVVDATSMMYIEGANIDFVDSLVGGGFRIDNPKAVSTCGCGSSFRTNDSEGAEAGGCSTCG